MRVSLFVLEIKLMYGLKTVHEFLFYIDENGGRGLYECFYEGKTRSY